MKNIFKILALSCAFFCVNNNLSDVMGMGHASMSRSWTIEEEELLQNIVSEKGLDEFSKGHASRKLWNEIAEHFPGRNGSQCRGKFRNVLFQNGIYKKYNHLKWTTEEDQLLLALTSRFGCKWQSFVQYFNERNAGSIKYRYEKLIGSQDIHGNEIEENVPDPVIISINDVPVDENLVPQHQ